MKWKLPIAVVIIGGAAALFTFNGRANTWARDAIGKLAATASAAPHPPSSRPERPEPPKTPFDGTILVLDADQLKTLGVELVDVKPQTEPVRIDVNGLLDYDQDTVTQIRPRFQILVSKVYVKLGQRVANGEPLVEIFSTELAKAKGDYEIAATQSELDKKQLVRSEELKKKGAISEKEYLEHANAEKKSRVASKVALDTLLLYGLSPDEIREVEKEEGEQKGHMTIRSPVEGIIIKRDAVMGQLYDVSNILFGIAPLDHFWVWGNVYPSDASRVSLEQPWVIECKFIGKNFRQKVDSISSNIDPNTKTVRVRTTIANYMDRLKADMMVTGYIEVAPLASRTVIPRSALISADGEDYVFAKISGGGSEPYKFARKSVRAIQERNDFVILAEGLKIGEEIAGRGSLILAQIYEDAASTQDSVQEKR